MAQPKQKPYGKEAMRKGRIDQRHLAWIRSQPCCVCQTLPAEAHHVRTAANAGTALRPPDNDVVPLCRFHHDELHRYGVQTFQHRYEVNLGREAAFYAAASGTQMP